MKLTVLLLLLLLSVSCPLSLADIPGKKTRFFTLNILEYPTTRYRFYLENKATSAYRPCGATFISDKD